MIHYLKFSSKTEAETALEGVEAVIDMVGEIYKTPEPVQNGTQDVDTGEGIVTIPTYQYFEPIKQNGFHVNLNCDSLPSELEQYQVFPQQPYRVWL